MLSLIAVAVLAAPSSIGSLGSLTTQAERSDYQRTGRYEEVQSLCQSLAELAPLRARCVTFGETPEGRPMVALVASDDGALTPEDNHRLRRPVVLAQGGIHAGEISGKDAGLELVRDLLTGKTSPGLLGKVTLVFVPVFNIDGHERFGPNNRPNQNGPAQKGWRTTAQNINLNRDYAKAAAPEMQAMLGLLSSWDPLLYVDLHCTDGAQFDIDVAIMAEPVGPVDPALRRAAKELEKALGARMNRTVKTVTGFYPSLNKEDDPTSGFSAWHASPRYSNTYWGLRNRMGLLVESHSWKPYKKRVEAARVAVLGSLELTAKHGKRWLATARKAESNGTKLGGKDVTLGQKTTDAKRTIRFLGVAYDYSLSGISGARWIRYHPDQPQTWSVPFYHELVPDLVVQAPKGGYLIPRAIAPMVEKHLSLHGVRFTALKTPMKLRAETYRATEVNLASKSYEGHQRLRTKGAWQPEEVSVAKGSLFVPIAQPNAVLAMQLLEPEARDSFLAWGTFNQFFEQKEYMEAYVAEAEARKMLAADKSLQAVFEEALAKGDMAGSKWKRLDFFYERHPSYDATLNRYPVFRVQQRPQ